jgi:hypothetical protein
MSSMDEIQGSKIHHEFIHDYDLAFLICEEIYDIRVMAKRDPMLDSVDPWCDKRPENAGITDFTDLRGALTTSGLAQNP